MTTTRKATEYGEIKKELAEIKQMLAERKHIDDAFVLLKHEYDGNGKPGFKQTRDKVSGWENKGNAIILLIVGDIVMRLVVLAF